MEWVQRWAAKSFYRAMGGLDSYTNPRLLQVPRDERPLELRHPSLFQCSATRAGNYSVRLLKHFSQRDLHPSGAAIVDAHFAVFVWTGRECSPVLGEMAMDVAIKFCE